MRQPGSRILRVALLTYPQSFRNRFGQDLLLAYHDRLRNLRGVHRAVATLRAAIRIASDGIAERSAPGPSVVEARSSGKGSGVWRDVSYAVRSFARTPAVTAIIVLTIALGIGANTAILAVVDGILVRPLEFADADRLVRVWSAKRDGTGSFFESTHADLVAFRDQTTAFETVAGFSRLEGTLQDDYAEPALVRVSRTTVDLFEVLRAPPALGRTFLPDDEASSARVVMLSHGLWVRRYGAARDVVGKTVRLATDTYTIVGVAPPTFSYPPATDLWRPYSSDERHDDDREITVIARLRAGVTPDVATAQVEQAVTVAGEQASESRDFTAWVQPLQATMVMDIKTSLLILLAAAGLVLLIACVNVANLLLARGGARARELALRTALGAGRGRLVRQLATENFVLAAAGGLGALGIGYALLRVVAPITPPDTPRLAEITFDVRIALATGALAAFVGLVFGILPALRGAGQDVGGLIGRAGVTRRARGGLQRSLVIGETALATVLAVLSLLLTTSLFRQFQFDRGMRTNNLVIVPMRGAHPETRAEALEFYARAQERLGALPGVRSVEITSIHPLEAVGLRTDVVVEGSGESGNRQAYLRVASSGFFQATGMSFVTGRAFAPGANTGGGLQVVVNEAFVSTYLASEDAGAARFRSPFFDQPLEITGVVHDVRIGPGVQAGPVVYLSFDQFPSFAQYLVLQTDVPTAQVTAMLRAPLDQLLPGFPLNAVSTIEQDIERHLASPRFTVLIIGSFAALAIVLAAVGIFGIQSHWVEKRIPELGIRHALGASRYAVLSLVIREGLILAGVGAAVGTFAAGVASRWVRSQLYGVGALDPAVYLTAAGIITAVTLAACVIPTRRAVTVDPVDALRAE